ncbi:cellulose binding domain-containing protein [Microbispora sp. NPDC046973]|uniref:cellulose binding domain-containing protein n=1 Tax=Microbispora sp. NPDC046973 TaxID=3155022 RepID=UPI0033F3176C
MRTALLGAGLAGAGLALAAAALPPASAAAGDTTPPSAPGTLRNCPLPAAPGSGLGIGVSLCWGAATDDVGVTGYDIQVKQSGAFTTIRTATGPGSIVSGLTLGQSYTFRVIARDAAGNAGPPSNDVTETANYLGGMPPSSPPPSPSPIDQTPPTRPEGLATQSVYVNGAVGLVWTPSTDDVGISTYEVHVWTDGAFPRAQATIDMRADQVTAVVTGLTPGRDYLFYVVARDRAGNLSAPSDLVRARAMVEPPVASPSPGPGTDTTPPGTPTGLTTVTGMDIPGGVFLAWNTVSDDSGVPPRYDLFRRTLDSYAYEGENATPRDIVTGLEGGKPYTFQVVARDGAGNLSNPSAPYTAIAQPGSTSSPSPSPSLGLSPSPSPSPSSSGSGCRVTYATTTWDGGFTATVTITNTGTAAIEGWKLGFGFPLASQRVTNGWSAVWTQSGTAVTAENYEWNKTIKPGQSLYLGFNGAYTGGNPTPAAFTLNGTTCS